MNIDSRHLEKTSEAIHKMAKRYPIETRKISKTTVDLIVARLESDTVQVTPTGVTGALRASIFGETYSNTKSVKGIVGTPIEYAPVIELGRRPRQRMPPFDPIELWVRRKLRKKPPESEEIAQLIRYKIARYGFEGKFMFKRTWDKDYEWMVERIENIPKEIRDYVRSTGTKR